MSARGSARERGLAAEEATAEFLSRQGLELLARNYRCRLGEVDIVAREGGTLVFVEVRSRRSGAWGGAAGSVDARKQSRLAAAARHYLARLAAEPPCRFDVVTWEGSPCEPHWIRGAFEQG